MQLRYRHFRPGTPPQPNLLDSTNWLTDMKWLAVSSGEEKRTGLLPSEPSMYVIFIMADIHWYYSLYGLPSSSGTTSGIATVEKCHESVSRPWHGISPAPEYIHSMYIFNNLPARSRRFRWNNVEYKWKRDDNILRVSHKHIIGVVQNFCDFISLFFFNNKVLWLEKTHYREL